MPALQILSGAAAQAHSSAISRLLRRAFELPEQQWSPDAVRTMFDGSGVRAFVLPEACALTRVTLDEAELLTIAVDQAARGRGLGADLVTAALDDARGAGAVRMILEVAAGNAAALALYRRSGFVECGRRSGYYRRGPTPDFGQREDALLMEAILT